MVLARRASLGDLPSLPPIFNHCIENTVISFRLSPIGVDFFEDILNTTCAHDLPFFVATTLASPTEPSTDVEGILVVENVIGYAYAMPWRASYAAYRHTIEISIYVHPEYQSVGAGTALMDTLMTALRTTRVRDPTANPDMVKDCDDDDGGLEKADGTGRIREVLVIMSLDIEGRDGGLGFILGGDLKGLGT
ncbi:Phosphinothricin N-acetyltransferase [Leucoagaricus sp. SymC.cos]|nr:Phosphinothricin N-acetyltransferase [Leucoagaricus sp. SymC.cos]